MDWSIDYLEEDAQSPLGGIVSMKTSGPADWDQNKSMSEEALALGRKKGVNRFLVDHRKIEHGLSVLQVDNLPRMLKQIGVTAKDKIAIVFDASPASPDSRSASRGGSQLGNAFSFFRDVSFLEGLAVRIFTDTKEATEWLESDITTKAQRH
jgi:hypothetical protein